MERNEGRNKIVYLHSTDYNLGLYPVLRKALKSVVGEWVRVEVLESDAEMINLATRDKGLSLLIANVGYRPEERAAMLERVREHQKKLPFIVYAPIVSNEFKDATLWLLPISYVNSVNITGSDLQHAIYMSLSRSVLSLF